MTIWQRAQPLWRSAIIGASRLPTLLTTQPRTVHSETLYCFHYNGSEKLLFSGASENVLKWSKLLKILAALKTMVGRTNSTSAQHMQKR